jgi:hypothetical protein
MAWRIWRFRRWQKARRKIACQLICESIQIALFPHAWESDYAQYAALQIWQILQATPVPGEEDPRGLASRGARSGERFLYGRFPKASTPGVSYQKRLSLWVEKALHSEKGRDVLRAIDAPRIDDLGLIDLSNMVGSLFMERLGVQRYQDPEINGARIWLAEEIRKYDSTVGLGGHRRQETGVTEAIEWSSALVSGGTVTFLLNDIGIHGLYSLGLGYGAALVAYFGSKILLRRRPLLPRQVAFRLYVLNVLCDFLIGAQGTDSHADRTVAGALGALERVRKYVAEQSAHEANAGQLESVHSTRRSPPGTGLAVRKQSTISKHPQFRTSADAKASATLSVLRGEIQRLVQVATDVDDQIVHAELIRLETVLAGDKAGPELLNSIGNVLEALSR